MQIPFLDLKCLNASIEHEIARATQRVIHSGWYILGKEVNEFEEKFASFCQANHCVGVANGLDAITLLLKAYDFPKNSEIIVPANTYIATIIAILQAGHLPVLVEPNECSYLIDETKIEQAITQKTKAILLVELYGRCSDLSNLRSLSKKHHLALLSDNAQSHGATYLGKPTPTWLDAAAFSFYPSKNLGALGDAGAVVSNDRELIERIKYLRNYGSGKKYVFDYIGTNSRLDEIQAAILNIKLPYLKEQLQRRREIAQRYLSEIKQPTITLPMADKVQEDAWHLFVIRCSKRSLLINYLAQNGIGSEIHYPIAPHKQYALQEYNHLSLPITEKLHDEVLSIPLNHTITEDEVTYIIKTLNNY